MHDELSSQVLGIFVKQPAPGRVKSRLAVDTSEVWAAEVAAAFLNDVLAKLSDIDARMVIAFSPPESMPYFAKVAADKFEVVPQSEGDLGQRLTNFIRSQQALGVERIVVIGTDSPTIPIDYIARSFSSLQDADIVLGPATDGGYYLVGCGSELPPLFDGIVWSESRVLFDSVARLHDRRWRLAVLPPWYDVDTLDDWWMLKGHVAALRRAGVDPRIPATEKLLQQAE